MKNATIRKSWSTLMTSALVLSTLGGVMASASSLVMAEGESPSPSANVNLVIHKKDATGHDGLVQNDGTTDNVLDKFDPVEGAGFKVYDLTDVFYALYKKLGSSEEAYEYLKTHFYSIVDGDDEHVTEAPSLVEQEKITDADGNAIFEAPRKNSAGRYAVYGIEESTIPADMTGSSPMIVGLSPKQDKMSDINLYPKNYKGVKKDLLNPDGTPVEEIDDETHSYEVGQELTYRVSFNVPNDIGTKSSYTEMKLYDRMTQAGADMQEIKSMTVGGESIMDEFGPEASITNYQKLPETPQDDNQAAGWSMTYDLGNDAARKAWAQHAGKLVTIEYTVRLNEDLVVDEPTNNDFTLTLDHNGDLVTQSDDGPDITTGGIKYVKVEKAANPDDEDAQLPEGLPGAQFVLKNAEGKYAVFTGEPSKPSDIEWITWSPDDENQDVKPTTITSDAKGVVAIAGLKYGEYTLTETKAPDGYILPDEEDRHTSFTVKNGTMTISKLRQIENVKETEGSLPMTGGIGVITLLVVGGGLMGAAALKRKREDEA